MVDISVEVRIVEEGEFVITYTYAGESCVTSNVFSDTINVQVFSESLIANPDTITLIFGDTIQLNASGTSSYFWSPDESLSCSSCPNPLAFPIEITEYIVSGVDSNGCRSLDTVLVNVDIICSEVFIPTIFSPNEKGPQSNETFCLFSDCVKQYKLVIHNRWGQLVFESEDIAQCWDGTFKGSEAATGTYAFNLFIRKIDGSQFNKTGTITLVR